MRSTLLFERLAKSRDKAGLMRLATEDWVVARPAGVLKDPTAGLPESHRLVESKLEEALITNLQEFLLELGKGLAFVPRQERITLDGDHFYVDLVFYHVVLKCFVLIDLKAGKLSHGDSAPTRTTPWSATCSAPNRRRRSSPAATSCTFRARPNCRERSAARYAS
mgnify:CR=1 FL=1